MRSFNKFVSRSISKFYPANIGNTVFNPTTINSTAIEHTSNPIIFSTALNPSLPKYLSITSENLSTK